MNKSFLKYNIATESTSFGVRILIQLFFPPLMLFYWGKDNFDLWLFLFAIPAFVAMFQISIIAPIRNHMLKLYREKKYSKLNNIYQNAFFLVVLNILLITSIATIYMVINFSNPFIYENLNLIIIAFTCLLLNLFASNSHAALSYKGSVKEHLKIEIFFDIIINFTVPVSYLIFSSFDSVFSLVLVLTLLKTYVLYSRVNDKYLNKFITFKLINFKDIKKVINLSLGFNFHILSTIIKGPGLIILLGTSNNLSLVGMISTARTMFYYLPLKFFDVFERSYFLEFTNIINTKKLNKDFRKHYLYLLIFCTIGLLVFMLFSNFFGMYIYNYWTHNFYKISSELIFLITLDILLIIIGSFLILPLLSLNKYNYIGLFELIINIVTFLILFSNNFFNNLIYGYKIIIISSSLILAVKFIYSLSILKNYAVRNK